MGGRFVGLGSSNGGFADLYRGGLSCALVEMNLARQLAAKRRAADDDWDYTTHSGTGHYVHFHGLIEFIRVSELDRKIVNVIWSKYLY